MPRDAAWALAFDTWVAQGDHHNDHPHNVILGWDNREPARYVFVDYEYAFGGGVGAMVIPNGEKKAASLTIRAAASPIFTGTDLATLGKRRSGRGADGL